MPGKVATQIRDCPWETAVGPLAFPVLVQYPEVLLTLPTTALNELTFTIPGTDTDASMTSLDMPRVLPP